MIGRHAGIVDYTVGQRRGLGLGGSTEPLYVVSLDAARNRVVAGPRAALETQTVSLDEMVYLDRAAQQAVELPVMAKLRSAQPTIAALFTADGTQGRLVLAAPALTGAAPGQAAVIYDGDRVIAGGWIARPVSACGQAAESTALTVA